MASSIRERSERFPAERSEAALFHPRFCGERWPSGARPPEPEKGGTEIVYELYGLTDEEIEIVEEAVGE